MARALIPSDTTIRNVKPGDTRSIHVHAVETRHAQVGLIKQLRLRSGKQEARGGVAVHGQCIAWRPVKRVDADIRRLQDDLSERLGTSVTIKSGRKNKGVLTIAFSGLEQLEGILARLRR